MKKKLIRKIMLGVMSLITVVSTSMCTPIYAASTADIENIAKNAPQAIIPNEDWTNIEVLNCKPLYNFSNELIAYSVDLKNNDNNKNAYVIVSKDEKDGPILQLGVDTESPYDKLSDDDKTPIYDGVSRYYYQEDSSNEYYDISNDKVIEEQEVDSLKLNSQQKVRTSKQPSKSKQLRTDLLEAEDPSELKSTMSSTRSGLEAHILTGVPDYRWRKGCAPTASAMVLKALYQSDLRNTSSSELIDELADEMDTDSNGSTYTSKLYRGINNVLSSHDIDGNARLYKNPSFSKAVSQIDKNRPFILSVYNNKQSLGSYSNGFGNHSMACLGYSKSSGSYLVVHDTACDGNIYCDYNSSSFGTCDYTFVD
ncbi:C39 family peptidase [Clostridium butyricum]|uniref:Galactose oxidase n=1 Tax=human gut metagenome TaxID=408170 RepID=W1Y4H4_9ZZZZ